MSKAKRYHPLALISHLFMAFKGTFFIFVLLLINVKSYSSYRVIAAACIAIIIIIHSVSQYLTTSYQALPGKIIIKNGVFNKKVTLIPYDNIQSIKQQQWFFFKPFQVVSITLETTGGQSEDNQITLAAVPEWLLEDINRFRLHRQSTYHVANQNDLYHFSTAEDSPSPTSLLLYQLSNRDILLYAFTDLSLFATALFLFSISDNLMPNWLVQWFNETFTHWMKAGVLMIILLTFITITFLILLSVIRHLIKFYNFTLLREDDILHIEYGLFQRQTKKVPIQNIQGIQIKQQLFRRLLKLSTVDILLSTNDSEDDTSGHLSILPIVHHSQVYPLIQASLPEWALEPPIIHQTSQDLLWYFIRLPLLIGLPALGLIAYFNLWFASIAGLLLLISLYSAYLKGMEQGFVIQGNKRLCVQHYTFFTKIITTIQHQKIQVYEERTSKWLYSKNIGHGAFTTKSGDTSSTTHLTFLHANDLAALKAFFHQK